MESGNRVNEEDSTFQWYLLESKEYRSIIKNIDELIIHLKTVKAKGFTHVNHDMIGLKFLTKKTTANSSNKTIKTRIKWNQVNH